MNRNFRYREAVPYWIGCVSVCSAYQNFRYETDAPKEPKICEITVIYNKTVRSPWFSFALDSFSTLAII